MERLYAKFGGDTVFYGIGRVLNLVAWRIECDTGRLNIQWNAIERVTDKVTQRYVVQYM